MVDYFKLGQGLIKAFPTTEGTISLGEKGIKSFAKRNPELGKSITELTDGVTNPTIEIVQKAQGNYSIACFKLKSGENLLEKGAYSTSGGSNGIVEKVHVESDGLITTMSKENGKTNMRVIEQPETQKVNDINIPKEYKLTHEEKVDKFFKLQSDVVKGLDKNNHWMKQDISNLSSKEIEELERFMNDAYKKGIKIPYEKDYKYLEMLLPMTDGKKHLVKIFPNYNKGKINMRIYMDKDIPADSFKTYRDASLESKQHPGACHVLNFEQNLMLDSLVEKLNSDNVFDRLTSRKLFAGIIQRGWTEKEAKAFVDSYEKETHYFQWQNGIYHSPLKPGF